MTLQAFKHWRRFEVDARNVAWLTLDKRGASTNVLSAEVLEELDGMLDEISAAAPAGMVIVSGKENGFIAGADVREFTQLSDGSEAAALVARGQAIVDRLEALPFPTVARIHGFCLGGGLELALACRYRIALDDPKTRLGLPEVLLGIHPGFGGTVRLTRLIGAPLAMDLMLSGRTVDARRALRLGFVDRVVPLRQLDRAASSLAVQKVQGRRATVLPLLTNHPLVRPPLAWYLRREASKKVDPSHYPAPFALIDLWRQHGHDPKRMLAEESRSVAQLITGETAKSLARLFFLRERVRMWGRSSDFTPRHVHVIGAGTMGGDIAAWCALRGFKVTLQDRAPELIAPALKRAYALFSKRLSDPRERQGALDRLIPDHEGRQLQRADLIIEAIVEDLPAKQTLYQQIEPQLKRGAFVATNTSSIPLERLQEAFNDSTHLVGLHFFNPVAKMPLVEVIGGSASGDDLVAKAAVFVKAIDRLPLPVKSAPGFLINRILMPYLLESVHLLEEGVRPAAIDHAACGFGMPMGPLELADTVGLDVCLSVGQILGKSKGLTIPARLRQLVDQGHLGRKTGQGFYRYKKGERKRARFPKIAENALIVDRLILPMLNESMACLRERVVEDADLLDAGMVFGTGFAPFRGGPMHYLARRGKAEIIARLHEFEGRYGQRFVPDTGWDSLSG
ncbi:MAG: 3-hydroxyacyl-CoA dehydrogenase NAD-binding domain-containing protein [Gammaproteobacteria bacterium]